MQIISYPSFATSSVMLSSMLYELVTLSYLTGWEFSISGLGFRFEAKIPQAKETLGVQGCMWIPK